MMWASRGACFIHSVPFRRKLCRIDRRSDFGRLVWTASRGSSGVVVPHGSANRDQPSRGHSSDSSSSGNKRLEYQHGFHAGNFADVFKHVMLVMILQKMMQKKNKPIGYVETHAGAGLYSLEDATANEQDDAAASYEKEHQRGVWQLLDLLHQGESTAELPPSVATYLNIARAFQPPPGTSSSKTLIYPGSPLFAASLLLNQEQQGTQHTMQLYEKAPAQLELLEHHLTNYLSDNPGRIDPSFHCDDGYTALTKYVQSTASLPPRALILLDPPYQYGSDTDQLAALCQTLRHHWRSARIAIWHPVRTDHADKLQRLYSMLRRDSNDGDEILAIEVYAPPSEEDNRKPDVGTGMILIQPPYGIDTDCGEVLPSLMKLLHPSADTEQAIQIKWL